MDGAIVPPYKPGDIFESFLSSQLLDQKRNRDLSVAADAELDVRIFKDRSAEDGKSHTAKHNRRIRFFSDRLNETF